MKSYKTDSSPIKVVVLGSRGFIGKMIVERLSLDSTYQVVGFTSSELNLTDSRQVDFKLTEVLRNAVVIITAAITRDRDNSMVAMIDNIRMAINIGNAIKNYPPSHVIYIGSVDVYGRRGLTLPLSESSKLMPSNPYAISKLTNEFILRNLCHDKKFLFTSLRLSPVYGPGDTHLSPIMRIINSALKRECVKLIGTGAELKDFLYIEDLSKIIKFIICKKMTGTFNVVTGKSYSINEIVKIIESLCGYRLEVEYSGNNEESNLIFEQPIFLSEMPGFVFTDIYYGLTQTFNFYKNERDISYGIQN